MPSDRPRGNGHEEKSMKFNLSEIKHFFAVRAVKTWCWLSREAVETPSTNLL